MRIFKFGGASVKDANGVRNVVDVLRTTGVEDTLLVISAMGKTTNAMEAILKQYFINKNNIQESLNELYGYHQTIASELFESAGHAVFKAVKDLIEELRGFLAWNKSPNHAFVYDQVVSYGELLSTTIVSHFLNESGLTNTLLDARNLVKTDTSYRDAGIDWELTQQRITKAVSPGKLYITQGFIGSDSNNFTTTLGREGSDYTAAIFAYCLDATSVTIWKDVPGVLNADPRYFSQTQLLHEISYREAIELAFYGASVIHPKTLQPLQRKEIPLYVKSFIHPTESGTAVSKGNGITPMVPCFIVKKDQVLLKLSSLNFSFMVEDNISEIFALLHKHRMKVDLIQNSAISFSVCVDNKFDALQDLVHQLKAKYKVDYFENVSLYTIRHFDEEAIAGIQKEKDILLEQRTTETVQLVVR